MAQDARRDPRAKRLSALDDRIQAARRAGEPKKRVNKEEYAAASYAWRMVIELVLSMMIGGAMGWGLDRLLGTLPAFLIVFILLGFGAGVRTMMRSAEEMQRRCESAEAESAQTGKDEGA